MENSSLTKQANSWSISMCVNMVKYLATWCKLYKV